MKEDVNVLVDVYLQKFSENEEKGGSIMRRYENKTFTPIIR